MSHEPQHMPSEEKLEVYVIPGSNGRVILSVPTERLAVAEASYGMRKAVDSLGSGKSRMPKFLGKAIGRLYDYYLKLEEKLDPIERVLKAMTTTNQFVVHTQSSEEFYRVLRRHRLKHVLWFSTDLVITSFVIVLTPLLAPLPGPNVFFYYPVLRLLSHYRAIQGASSGLRADNIEFKTDRRAYGF